MIEYTIKTFSYNIPETSIKNVFLDSKISNELLSGNIAKAHQISRAIRIQNVAKNIKLGEMLMESGLIN